MAEISQIRKIVFQLRRATTEEWNANENVVPHEGEPCYDLTLRTLKIGDGKTPYKDLQCIGGVSMSDDGLSLIVENLQADVAELQELVGDDSIDAKIDAKIDEVIGETLDGTLSETIDEAIDEAIGDIVDESELQDILNSILNN